MKHALNNQVGMLANMFLWLVANLKQGVIYFIKQALPPNISAGSVSKSGNKQNNNNYWDNSNSNAYIMGIFLLRKSKQKFLEF